MTDSLLDKSRRNLGLDIARALAISMVFLSHGSTYFQAFRMGVDLFFVLSGFLVGRIYLRSQASGQFSLFGFWRARWLRTLPPYLAAVGIAAVSSRYFHTGRVSAYYLLFLQNYLGIHGLGISWSLCIEEHFYLALPLLGFLLVRFLGRRQLLWALPVLALVSEGLRIFETYTNRLPKNWWWRTHLHFEGLVLGVWLAYVFLDHPALWKRLRWPGLVLSALPFFTMLYEMRHPAEALFYQATVYLIYAVGFTGFVRFLYDVRWSSSFAPARLAQSTIHGLAMCSYSIYLLHTMLFTDIRIVINHWTRGSLKTAVILSGALLISVLFYFLVERPTIQVRDRYFTKGKVPPKPLEVVAN